MEKLWLFGLFSGDKGDNTDMWMIKITIKANQIDMDVLLISKVDNIQKPCLSLKSGFSIISLVCEFYPHGQTWYQKFIGTYTPLVIVKNLALALNSAIFSSTCGQSKREQTSNLLRKSHSSVSSSAFYHLIYAKTKMAPLTSRIFRRNDIVKDFRKARKDPVE